MECVSELDETVREKCIKLFQKVETDKRNELYKKIIKIYKKSNDGRNKSLKNFFNVEFTKGALPCNEFAIQLQPFSISELVENVQITDSNRNLKVLALIYYSVYGKNDIYDKIISYIDLLEKRNKLAHITQEKEGDNFIFRNKKDNSKTYILTVEESLLLRKSILDLDNVFKNIN